MRGPFLFTAATLCASNVSCVSTSLLEARAEKAEAAVTEQKATIDQLVVRLAERDREVALLKSYCGSAKEKLTRERNQRIRHQKKERELARKLNSRVAAMLESDRPTVFRDDAAFLTAIASALGAREAKALESRAYSSYHYSYRRPTEDGGMRSQSVKSAADLVAQCTYTFDALSPLKVTLERDARPGYESRRTAMATYEAIGTPGGTVFVGVTFLVTDEGRRHNSLIVRELAANPRVQPDAAVEGEGRTETKD